MVNEELMHHGVKGMKWGVRRMRTNGGSLKEVSKKAYNKALNADKKTRWDLESRAYDQSRIATLYDKKAKLYDKKYQKALQKDPDKLQEKTRAIERSKKALDTDAFMARTQNTTTMNLLRVQVDSMKNKYADTRIKDIKSETSKRGIEFVKSWSSSLANSNASYSLAPYRIKNDNGETVVRYKPVKTRTYYY